MHVLILLFSKLTPRYHGRDRTLASENLWNAKKHIYIYIYIYREIKKYQLGSVRVRTHADYDNSA